MLYMMCAVGFAAAHAVAARRRYIPGNTTYATKAVDNCALFGLIACIMCYASPWFLIGVAVAATSAGAYLSFRMIVDERGIRISEAGAWDILDGEEIDAASVSYGNDADDGPFLQEFMVKMRSGTTRDLSSYDLDKGWLERANRHLRLSDEEQLKIDDCQRRRLMYATTGVLVLLLMCGVAFGGVIDQKIGWLEVPRLADGGAAADDGTR